LKIELHPLCILTGNSSLDLNEKMMNQAKRTWVLFNANRPKTSSLTVMNTKVTMEDWLSLLSQTEPIWLWQTQFQWREVELLKGPQVLVKQRQLKILEKILLISWSSKIVQRRLITYLFRNYFQGWLSQELGVVLMSLTELRSRSCQ